MITPPVGLDLEGYFRDGPSTGVLDELSCQAVVFDDGTTRLVLAVCDLIGLTRQLRDLVCARIDLPPEHLMLTATHTHCGPAHLASPDHVDLVSRLADGVVEAITAATEAIRPAWLGTGTVPVRGIAANRRDPAGPLDENATFLAAFGQSGPIATIVNFACHPTVQGAETRGYSADFPGAARRTIEQLCGGHAVYLQGTSGDVNPVRTERTAAEAHRTGTILGAAISAEVLTTARSVASPHVSNPSLGSTRPISLATPLQPAPLAARWTDVPVEPFQQPPPAEIRARRAAATDPAQIMEWGVREYLVAGTGFDSFDYPVSPATLPVQAFRLSRELVLVGLPGEPFTATGRRIRAAGLVAGYANQAAGYLPTVDEFDRSGYEVGCSMYAPGTAERLESAAIELVTSLL
ncbi:MAG TPA: hypothetical protein VHZ97_31685 [Pseudonocardiaceae bacterium]|nr:hypothetical protein [Pseudonocardiaceae bacterium]